MPAAILAIDQGTTSSRALIFDRDLNVLGVGQQEFEQIFPKPGWVEHNPDAIWASVRYAVSTAIEKAQIRPTDIVGVGITNQRETIVVWDRQTGKPLHNAIVWQCRRTADDCARLRAAGHEPAFTERTGLVLDPYFSGTKLAWLLDHVSGLRAKAEAGQAKAGTIDAFLVDRLSGGTAHVTDASNASRTLLFNIHNMAWDEELARILNVPLGLLPRAASSSEVYGRTKGLDFLPDGIPISGMAGDQQAALFGQACFEVGEAKCTYGTGAFLLMNTGSRAVASKNKLLTTVAWQVNGRTSYALEGSAFIAGAAVQWLRDGLGLISKSSDVEALAAKVPSSDGVVVVPAFAGLGAPHWNPQARAAITGITRGTTAAHIARACLEGVALQNYEILHAMEADSGAKLSRLKVDGGASANALLMQYQADVLGCTIVRPRMLETTVLGAAFLAGLAVKLWNGVEDIRKTWKVDREFAPQMPAADREAHIARWRAAVAKA
ncbi:MAG: glycerol kinase [Myxococcales bacterium]|nr:MAG: glycerol kinase [Myxococcales bacterium]